MEQTHEQLLQHLRDHLGFLSVSCSEYDRGNEAEAKRLAVSLRLIFHHTARSISLLGQLPELAGMKMYDTAAPVGPNPPHLKSSHLEMVLVGDGRYLPKLDDTQVDGRRERFTTVDEWWTNAVMRDFDGRLFSRADLVLSVANQDGGVHVDPVLDDPYHALVAENSLQRKYSADGVEWKEYRPPVAACIRQVAHESLVSFALHAPQSFSTAEQAEQYRRIAPPVREVYGASRPLLGGPNIRVATAPQPQLASSKKRVGRNERCPCGSGLKYKRCCGQ